MMILGLLGACNNFITQMEHHACWANRKQGSGGDLAAVDSLEVDEVEGGGQSDVENN